MKINVYLSNKAIGNLYVDKGNGKTIYSFEYIASYLKNKNKFMIDMELPLLGGRQYSSNSDGFRFIYDSLPDRYGRHIINIKEEIDGKKENRNARKFDQIDYILKTSDYLRMGAIRYSLDEGKTFVSEDNKVPKLINLASLENYSFLVNENISDTTIDAIHKILSPGSSLGGSRPKIIVRDNGVLYLAKFPKKDDEYDISLWEYVAYSLAKLIKINVSDSLIKQYSKYGHIFISKRFDREKEERVHYMSFMTLLNATDGNNENYSYVDLANVITKHSNDINEDLKELFVRLVFNLRINNIDDHLRNHGMIIKDNKFYLSPAFDINPSPYLSSFQLSKERDRKSLLGIAKYFRISEKEANNTIDNINNIVSNNWRNLAIKIGAKKREIELFKPILDKNIR